MGRWLARWDEFRQTDWASEVEYPELTLKKTEELLSIQLDSGGANYV